MTTALAMAKWTHSHAKCEGNFTLYAISGRQFGGCRKVRSWRCAAPSLSFIYYMPDKMPGALRTVSLLHSLPQLQISDTQYLSPFLTQRQGLSLLVNASKNHASHSSLSAASMRRQHLRYHHYQSLCRARSDMFPARSLPSRALVNALDLWLGSRS